jgi:hypothetical protein
MTEYFEVLQQSINAIHNFNPDYIVLSLGFDTYEHDPIAGLNITEDGFREIGHYTTLSLFKANSSCSRRWLQRRKNRNTHRKLLKWRSLCPNRLKYVRWSCNITRGSLRLLH